MEAFRLFDRQGPAGVKQYRSGYCNPCQNQYLKDRRVKHPDEVRAAQSAYYRENSERILSNRERNPDKERNWKFKHAYGITLSEYQELLAEQDGACAICRRHPQEKGRRKFLSVDHDHDTGQVRGLLCTPCNMALGGLQDSPELLRAALAYLEGG